MPATLSYPGVYIQEIPSGVRTITGVATSITAFIGRAKRGPTDKAVTINNFGDFDRIFGGIWLESTLGYAVRDFYLNGGGQAVIVRLFNPFAESSLPVRNAVSTVVEAAKTASKKEGSTAKSIADAVKTEADKLIEEAEKKAANDIATVAKELSGKNPQPAVADVINELIKKAEEITLQTFARLVIGQTGIGLKAAYPGSWGSKLVAEINDNVSNDVASRLGLKTSDLFNLTVRENISNGLSENFLNLTTKPSARQLDKILENESRLARWDGDLKIASIDVETIFKKINEEKEKLEAKNDELKKLVSQFIILMKESPDDEEKIKKMKGDVSKKQSEILAIENMNKGRASDASDGKLLTDADFKLDSGEDDKEGLYALEQLYAQGSLFNLLCIPPRAHGEDVGTSIVAAAAQYCEKRRAMLLVDSPVTWKDKGKAKEGFTNDIDQVGTRSKNAALFFPRIKQPNPLRGNQIEEFVPCGAIAGIFARTDSNRGVWKAPAGLETSLNGVPQLSAVLTDEENGELNQLGINCLRVFPVLGRIVWGSRTLRGADQLADEWKYIPVRRTALFIEESLYRGTQWVVFEPNDEPLWSQIRLNIGAFMHSLFRQGAFQGKSPKDAYFVKCDKETTTQDDINRGIVNIHVGFAPLKPAEFVVISIQQMAGQIQV